MHERSDDNHVAYPSSCQPTPTRVLYCFLSLSKNHWMVQEVQCYQQRRASDCLPFWVKKVSFTREVFKGNSVSAASVDCFVWALWMVKFDYEDGTVVSVFFANQTFNREIGVEALHNDDDQHKEMMNRSTPKTKGSHSLTWHCFGET